MTVNRLIDRYNRRLNYLRISITDRCNLSCIYCIPQGIQSKLPQEEILSYEEILRLVRICVGLGISKVRVTGGEPLVRKGVFDFLANLNSINGITDVSLTTNGTGLKDRLEQIQSAGIKRINISLDTLNKHKYKKLTGFDKFDDVWEGIVSALDKDFNFQILSLGNSDPITLGHLVSLIEKSLGKKAKIKYLPDQPGDSSITYADISKSKRLLGYLWLPPKSRPKNGKVKVDH